MILTVRGVVNLGGATCADVLALCDEVLAIVYRPLQIGRAHV